MLPSIRKEEYLYQIPRFELEQKEIKDFEKELREFNGQFAAMTVKISLTKTQEIGRIIQFHRRQAGLSRIGLADIAGVGKTVVFDAENGKETVRLNTLFKILEALNISISLDSPLMDRYKVGEDAQG